MYLLDTDILIYSLKGESTVLENFKKFATEPKAISVITYGELVFGAQCSQKATENLAKVYKIKEIFPLIDVTPAIMDIFGALKRICEKTVRRSTILISLSEQRLLPWPTA